MTTTLLNGQSQEMDQRLKSREQANDFESMEHIVKKVIELKEGRPTSIISSLPTTSNKVRLRKYSGAHGLGLLILRAVAQPGNFLLGVLLVLVLLYQDTSMVSIGFPLFLLGFNFFVFILLGMVENSRLEAAENMINSQPVDCLAFKASKRKFKTAAWGDLEVGSIVKIYKHEEAPADCLVLDAAGIASDL
mmetsp:Transcript_40739/g.62184  ORF Transcript_40739/g.62184 Transcript_40739/m.62184 type:complete len:191 (-) Transcript_40739:17-589(-)